MLNVLKGWLTDNTVTGEDKGDKILTLESAGNLTNDDVIAQMKKKDTGLHLETLKHSVNLYNETLAELVLNGYSINTGLFRMVAQFRGLIEGGAWNPAKNSVLVQFTQDKILRGGIGQTSVKILGEKGDTAYIAGGKDAATRATDGLATPGRTYHLTGRNIKVFGSSTEVGVYLIDASGTKQKLDQDMIALNNPSDVIIQLPADLKEETYELRIVTQFSNGNKELKAPRTVSKQLGVGKAPGGGDDGGGVEDPTA